MASYEAKGKLKQVLEIKRGSGQKGDWQSQDFVIEVTDGQYKNDLCFQCDPNKISLPSEGSDITVHFNLKSREWQGRWFTQANAWKIVVDEQSAEQGAAFGNNPPNDDMPF